MIDRATLQRLAALRNPDGLLLSAFVSTSVLDDWRQTTPTFLHSELRRIERETNLAREERRSLEGHFKALHDLVQYEVGLKTEAVSTFADGGAGFVERIDLPLRLSNRIVLAPFAYLRPLVGALDRLKPFMVVRVGRDESVIYEVNDWRLTGEVEIEGPYLKSTDRETGQMPVKQYYAAARQDTLVELHYKDVASALEKRLSEVEPRQVVLCGVHDIVSHFRKNLSRPAAAAVRAEIAWDAAASVGQVLVAARDALVDARAAAMEALTLRISESLGQGRGVAGFDDTMVALHQGKVATLLVDAAFAPPGWVCVACDFAGLAPTETCPLCGARVHPAGDVAAEAIRVALLRGTFVEEAADGVALAALGGIAGLERYR